MLRYFLVLGLASSACARSAPAPQAAREEEPAPPPAAAVADASETSPKRRSKRPSPSLEPSGEEGNPTDDAMPLTQVQPAPPVNDSNRCVVGTVETQGDMVVPVNNAQVMLFRSAELLGETRTDANGKFAWCAGPNLDGAEFEVTVRVSKSPFPTVSQSRGWKVGVQEQFDFALTAPSF